MPFLCSLTDVKYSEQEDYEYTSTDVESEYASTEEESENIEEEPQKVNVCGLDIGIYTLVYKYMYHRNRNVIK